MKSFDLGSISVNEGDFHFQVSLNRVSRNIEKAQKYLDNAVLKDCNKIVPFRNGALRRSGIDNTVIGSGEVVWSAVSANKNGMGGPYARFQYYGNAMVGVYSRRAYALPKEPKELNGKKLTYHHPGTGSHWFDKAKRLNGDRWVKDVKRIAGGG